MNVTTENILQVCPIDMLRAEIPKGGMAKVARDTGLSHAAISLAVSGKCPLALENRLRVALALGFGVRVEIGRRGKRGRPRKSAAPTEAQVEHGKELAMARARPPSPRHAI